MNNPYASPSGSQEAKDRGDESRSPRRIWFFAILWPPFAILGGRVILSCAPFFRPAIYLWFLPVLVGYAICIIAAAGSSGTRWRRVLRALGAMLLMIFAGFVWQMILGVATSLIR